jgi:tRNA 2-thiocytidine biosynthesis protein TtcA
MEFPILPCNLCGSQEQLMRKQVKRLLNELEQHAPRARQSMLAAMMNVRPSQLLDKDLWRVLGLAVASKDDSAAAADLARIEQTDQAESKLRLPVV